MRWLKRPLWLGVVTAVRTVTDRLYFEHVESNGNPVESIVDRLQQLEYLDRIACIFKNIEDRAIQNSHRTERAKQQSRVLYLGTYGQRTMQ